MSILYHLLVVRSCKMISMDRDQYKKALKKRKIVTTEADLQEAVENMLDAEAVCFDAETSDVDIEELCWYALGIYDGDTVYYIPLKQKQKEIEEGQLFAINDNRGDEYLEMDVVVEGLKPIFENEEISKIGHNLKFDIRILQRFGIDVKGDLFDTKVASWLLDENASHALKDLGARVFGVKTIHFGDLVEKGRDFLDVPTEKAAEYSAQDVILPWELAKVFLQQLKEEDMLRHFFEIEMPFLWCLIEMENNGFPIDLDGLLRYGDTIIEVGKESASRCYEIAGDQFNLNSSQQLSDLLFGKMGYKPVVMTKSGKPSTSAEVMESLANQGCELAEAILGYRAVEKIRSTYIDAMPGHVADDGRIHSKFSPTGTVTGRLNSASPNLQNIPSRGDIGAEIRKFFVASPGNLLVVADYSQIELRILAHESQDKRLMEAYQNGEDIHRQTASLVYKIPEESVSKDQRGHAKCVTGDTLIPTDRGLKRIKELSDFRTSGEFVDLTGISVMNSEGEYKPATSFYYGGTQRCKRITIRGKRTIEGTHNHRIRVKSDNGIVWKYLSDIVVGDEVVTASSVKFPKNYVEVPFNFWSPTNSNGGDNLPKITVDEKWGEVFGVIFGDGGYCGESSVQVSGHKRDIDMLESFAESAKSVGLNPVLRDVKGRVDNVSVYLGSRRLQRFLRHLEIKEDHVPQVILDSPEKVVCAYIRGLFDTDGWHGVAGLGFCSQHYTFTKELQTILFSMGIYSNFQKKYNKTYDKNYWALTINRADSVKSFMDKIGFNSSRKRLNPDGIFYKCGSKGNCWKRDEVVAIEDTEAEVFDLYVPDGNEFVGNGFVNHNSMNFGLVYGMSAVGFAKQVRISEGEAARFIKRYFAVYHGVDRFIKETHKRVEAHRYVKTISGRKRRLPEAASEDYSTVSYAHRQAVNAIVQGSAADLIKKAMIEIRKQLPIDCRCICQVHDELIFEVPEDNADKYAKKIKKIMEESYSDILTVPVIAEVNIAKSWYEGK